MKSVGRAVPRLEARAKVRGAAQFVGDLPRAGLLHGVLVRSPYAHARIAAIDDGPARLLPGVIEVLSSVNVGRLLPDAGPYDIACGSLDRPADVREVPGDARLFDRVARFVGDPVALVVADSERAARVAAEAVGVDYEVLPPVLSPAAALAADAPLLHDGAPGNVAAEQHWSVGDVDAAFADAALVVERTFRTQRQKHAQLEPTACLAEPDGAGGIILHAPSQVPHRLRHTIATTFGLPLSGVRVVVPTIGGAFGKNEGLAAEPYAVAGTLVTGRPVLVTYDRQEDLTATDVRHPSESRLAAAFRADGSIAALRGRVLLDAGAYLGHSAIVAPVVLAQLLATYRLEAFDLEAVAAFTHHLSSGAFRGYGGPQAVFPIECLIDIAARELGIDPIAARRRMHVRAGDAYGPLREPIVGAGLEPCLDRGAAAFGWDERERRRTAGLARSQRRGFGMACVAWKSGVAGAGFDQSAAIVSLEPDGSVLLATASPDLGTGIRTTLAQICTEVVGVGLDRVTVTPTDTAVTPFDVGAFASRSLYRMGAAVERAAGGLRAQILDEAAGLLEIAQADLEVDGPDVVVRGSPQRRVALELVARRALHEGRSLAARGEAPPTMAPAWAAQFAEVVVDVQTGVVAVERIVNAQDVGRAINPGIVIGQIAGAVAQGLGFALHEDLSADPETGTVRTGSLMDYTIPTAADMPPIEVILVEDPDPTGPFGARGAGEPAITLTAPAIANAVLDALGTAPTALPLTPVRVRELAWETRPGSGGSLAGHSQISILSGFGRPALYAAESGQAETAATASSSARIAK